MNPGEYVLGSGEIEANKGRRTQQLTVMNTGDRPIQVGSHFHVFEVNKALDFNRSAAFGMRLNIPAGTAVRFEPGEAKDVVLVAIGGKKTVHGLNNLTNGYLGDESQLARSLMRAAQSGFKGINLKVEKR
ncbi:MAG: urease subunit beta [Candidatus Aquicultorales bacterium]